MKSAAWLKTTVTLAGLMLAVPGMFLAIAYLCFTPLSMASGDRDALRLGLASFMLMVMTLGAGGVLLWHGLSSAQGRPSALLRLPPAWLMAAVFGLFVTIGFFIHRNNLAAGFSSRPSCSSPLLFRLSWPWRGSCGSGSKALPGGAGRWRLSEARRSAW
jgi:hypothetical protein